MITWWDMTDCHFSGYHITGIRILITGGHPFGAGIARTLTPCINITNRITGAEQPVVRTGKIIRRIHADIVELVTGIHGTVDSVITVDRRARQAGASSGITGLRTVAEESIIAVCINRALGLRLAYSVCRITLFTNRTFHRHKEATGDRIAIVGCAKVSIVAIQRRTCLAIVDRIAGFGTGADVAVVAGSVIWRVCTRIVGLVAGICGTTNPVITVRWRTHLAGAGSGVTGLCTITEHGIIAIRINRTLGRCLALSVCRVTLLTSRTFHGYIGATGQRITAIVCTKIPIVAVQRRTCLAIVDRIAGFSAVADVVVVAGSIIRRVHTCIAGLVAGIHGAANPVITVRRRTRLAAASSGVTGLLAVAEKSIITVRVNRTIGLRLAYTVC
jgi:hypothetical protein